MFSLSFEWTAQTDGGRERSPSNGLRQRTDRFHFGTPSTDSLTTSATAVTAAPSQPPQLLYICSSPMPRTNSTSPWAQLPQSQIPSWLGEANAVDVARECPSVSEEMQEPPCPTTHRGDHLPCDMKNVYDSERMRRQVTEEGVHTPQPTLDASLRALTPPPADSSPPLCPHLSHKSLWP